MELYEIVEPFNKGLLKVSDLHSIYFEEVGNKKAYLFYLCMVALAAVLMKK